MKEEHTDLLGVAGWMYADLFLALMVIFLATISFVPAFSHSSTTASSHQKQTTADYFKAMSRTYTEFNSNQLLTDVMLFEDQEGLPYGARIIYAHFIGGYDPATESTSNGNFRALIFSQKTASINNPIFNRIETHLDASDKLKPNQVAVVFTFGPVN